MPSTLILKPCHRTAATMQAKMESSSLGSGRPKWMSKSRVSTTSIRAYSLAFSFVAQCSMWWRMTAGQETPINLLVLVFLVPFVDFPLRTCADRQGSRRIP